MSLENQKNIRSFLEKITGKKIEGNIRMITIHQKSGHLVRLRFMYEKQYEKEKPPLPKEEHILYITEGSGNLSELRVPNAETLQRIIKIYEPLGTELLAVSNSTLVYDNRKKEV